MNTFAHSVVVNAITSIDQRLRWLWIETATTPSSQRDPMMLN